MSVPAPLDPKLYDALFADVPEHFKSLAGNPALAWFFEGRTITAAALDRIIDDPACEPRLAYLACHCARQKGVATAKKKLFGAIIEYPIEAGHDVLAVFADKNARYYNHSGKAIIIEGDPGSAAPAIEKLLWPSRKRSSRSSGPGISRGERVQRKGSCASRSSSRMVSISARARKRPCRKTRWARPCCVRARWLCKRSSR